ncbi:pyridoxal phosphate biosynthetic protein [Helicobacter mustelae]|uniref:pyridoxine 5'-phosphate synthase n=1 Tax=Helicobacter mustelae TaxID=217 RepID=UPI000E05D395|nr:pyridoxine 5'-phosphate synthase [Helicobacter mustelae]STP11913.1 pyridoxal phosphate biosynthetic protein [Helicobacter mustelae]STP14157.1 pyridoxal phosphate biosynthetic protein [Helicobacter mustelae]
MHLGLNIDHIATLREARKINDPNPLEAIFIAKNCGVFQITIHLREDRRHIHDLDVKRILQSSFLPINVECALDENIIEFLCAQKPYKITLVPEKREEVTTEGGLSLKNPLIKDVIKTFHQHGILVATFVDPDEEAILLSKEYGADGVELHTGAYANATLMRYSNLSRMQNSIVSLQNLSSKDLNSLIKQNLKSLHFASVLAHKIGLEVYAGHGLNYHNVEAIAKLPHITELNIGQSIIAKSVFVGLERAILDMIQIITTTKNQTTLLNSTKKNPL